MECGGRDDWWKRGVWMIGGGRMKKCGGGGGREHSPSPSLLHTPSSNHYEAVEGCGVARDT